LTKIEPQRIELGIDRLADDRPGEPPFGERARRKRRQRGGQRRQRTGRGIGRRAHRGEFARRHIGDDFGNEIVFRREVAIDRACRDARALGHGRDLHGLQPGICRERDRRLDDRPLACGEPADHVFRAAVRHAWSEW
jgi:hypothetical protein